MYGRHRAGTVKQQIQQVTEARQIFDEASARLRPDLHRFCARMTGSLSDGEDLVQEVLVHAFYRLPELREGASLRAWLFRVAHNRCIDHLRGRRHFVPLDDEELESNEALASLEDQELAQQVLVAIFTQLPPKERACVVLKDVLGYSLEEAAEITASTVSSVKAAIHRARGKLAGASSTVQAPVLDDEERDLVERYIARFNARDWDGVRALLSADARLEVVERIEGQFDGRYFTNYAALSEDFRLERRLVEGVPAIVQFRAHVGGWLPHSLLLVSVEAGKISRVRDYVHVPYLLRGAKITQSSS
jgi:RNA polymerase sigma-70 factor (ECF subfamily)